MQALHYLCLPGIGRHCWDWLFNMMTDHDLSGVPLWTLWCGHDDRPVPSVWMLLASGFDWQLIAVGYKLFPMHPRSLAPLLPRSPAQEWLGIAACPPEPSWSSSRTAAPSHAGCWSWDQCPDSRRAPLDRSPAQPCTGRQCSVRHRRLPVAGVAGSSPGSIQHPNYVKLVIIDLATIWSCLMFNYCDVIHRHKELWQNYMFEKN